MPTKMTPAIANAIYDILVEHAGAPERHRGDFVHTQQRTDPICAEYRFQGNLGFGGKFWRNPSINGQTWYVNAYREDEDRWPDIRPAITTTNAALADLHAQHPGLV